MGFASDTVDVVTFDSFSTLVDVDSTAAAVRGLVDDPVSFAREWHGRAVMYAMIANYLDVYETYDELHWIALEHLLGVEGVSVSETELADIASVYHDMEPFEDVRPGLERLTEAGYEVGIVSNGDPSLLDSMRKSANVDDMISESVSADDIECFKPACELYVHAADRLDADVASIAHVSNGQVDIHRLDDRLSFDAPDEALAYHGHCHQKATNSDHHAVGVLRRAGYEVDPLDSGCCGMAGSFGYHAEHYDLSQAIGDRLFERVADSPADTVVAPGGSCRTQIGDRPGGHEPPHPVEKVAEALE